MGGPGTVSSSGQPSAAQQHAAWLQQVEAARRRAEQAAREAAERARQRAEDARRQANEARKQADDAKKLARDAADKAAKTGTKEDKDQAAQLQKDADAKELTALKQEARAHLADKEYVLAKSKLADAQQGRKAGDPSDATRTAQHDVDLARQTVDLYEKPGAQGAGSPLAAASQHTSDLQKKAEDAAQPIIQARSEGREPTKEELEKYGTAMNDWLEGAQQEMRLAGIDARAKGQDPLAAIQQQRDKILQRVEDGGVFKPKAMGENLDLAATQVKAESPAVSQLRSEQYTARTGNQKDYDDARTRATDADAAADKAEKYADSFTSVSTDSQATAADDARADAKRLRKIADDAQADADRLKLHGDSEDARFESDIADLDVGDKQAALTRAEAGGDPKAIAQAKTDLNNALDYQRLAHAQRDSSDGRLKLSDGNQELADAQGAWDAEAANQPKLQEVTSRTRGGTQTRLVAPDGYDATFALKPDNAADRKKVQLIDGKYYLVTRTGRYGESKTELNPVTQRLWRAYDAVHGTTVDGKPQPGLKAQSEQADGNLKLALEDLLGPDGMPGGPSGKLDDAPWLEKAGDIAKNLTDANQGVTDATNALNHARAVGASPETITQLETDLGTKLQVQRQAQGLADTLKLFQDLRAAQRDLARAEHPDPAGGPVPDLQQARDRVADLTTKVRDAVTKVSTPQELAPQQVQAARTRLGDNRKLLKDQDGIVERKRTAWEQATGTDKETKHKEYTDACDTRDRLQRLVASDESLVNLADADARADAATYTWQHTQFVKPTTGYYPGMINLDRALEDQPAGFDPTAGVLPPENYTQQLLAAKPDGDGVRTLSDGTKIKADGTWVLKDGTEVRKDGDKYVVRFKTTMVAGGYPVQVLTDPREMNPVTAHVWDARQQAFEAAQKRQDVVAGLKDDPALTALPQPGPQIQGADGKPLLMLNLTDDLSKRKPLADQALTDATTRRKQIEHDIEIGNGDPAELQRQLADARDLEAIAGKEVTAVDAILAWQNANQMRQDFEARERAGLKPVWSGPEGSPQAYVDKMRDKAVAARADWLGAQNDSKVRKATAKVDQATTAHDNWKRAHPELLGSEKSSDTWKALQGAKDELDLAQRAQAGTAALLGDSDRQQLIAQSLRPDQYDDPHALYKLFMEHPQEMAQGIVNQHYMAYGSQPIEIEGRTHLANEVARAFGWQTDAPLDPQSPEANLQAMRTRNLYGQLSADQKTVLDQTVQEIVDVGGEHAKVTVLPVVYALDSDQGGIVKTALFKVEAQDGSVKYVDEAGRSYQDLDDYRANNTLPVEDVNLVMPEGGEFKLDAHGNVKLFSGDARTETGWQTFRRETHLDLVVGVVGLVAGAVVTIGSLGTLSVPGGAMMVASGALIAAGGYGVVTSAQSLNDQASHGQSINPFTSSQARIDWLNLGLSAASVPVVGGTARASMLALRAKGAMTLARDAEAAGNTTGMLSHLADAAGYSSQAQAWARPATLAARPLGVGSGVAFEEGARSLIDNWDSMTPQQREEQLAMLGINAGGFLFGVGAKRLPGARVPAGGEVAPLKLGAGETPTVLPAGSRPAALETGLPPELAGDVPVTGPRPGVPAANDPLAAFRPARPIVLPDGDAPLAEVVRLSARPAEEGVAGTGSAAWRVRPAATDPHADGIGDRAANAPYERSPRRLERIGQARPDDVIGPFREQVGLPVGEKDSGGIAAMLQKFLSPKGLREFADAVSSTPRVKRHNTSSWITGRVQPADYALVDVPIASVRSQHSVDGVAVAKTAQRADAAFAWLEANPQATRLDMPTLDTIAGSTGSIKVGWGGGERFITLDGVGRVEAVKGALARYQEVHGTAHPLREVEAYGVRLTRREYQQLHRTSTFFRDEAGTQYARPQHDLVPYTAVPRFVAGTALNVIKKAAAPLWQKLPMVQAPDRRIPVDFRSAEGIGSTQGAWRVSWGREHPLAASVNPTGSRTNCIASSVTLERMLARPGLELQAVPTGPGSLRSVEAAYGELPTLEFGSARAARQYLRSLPPDARGFVIVASAEPAAGQGVQGHMLNFVRNGRRTEVIDAQAGRYVSGFDGERVYVAVTHRDGRSATDMGIVGPGSPRALDALARGGESGVHGRIAGDVDAGDPVSDPVTDPATVGVPATHDPNPRSPVLEYDAHGNEIYYRTMSEAHYKALVRTGRVSGTGETSLAPLEVYSRKYRGVLVRLTTKPGTADQLKEIGIAANEPAAAEFPGMPTEGRKWAQHNARFKMEATGIPVINDGQGVMNTQLGKGDALEIFNRNLVDFQNMDE